MFKNLFALILAILLVTPTSRAADTILQADDVAGLFTAANLAGHNNTMGFEKPGGWVASGSPTTAARTQTVGKFYRGSYGYEWDSNATGQLLTSPTWSTASDGGLIGRTVAAGCLVKVPSGTATTLLSVVNSGTDVSNTQQVISSGFFEFIVVNFVAKASTTYSVQLKSVASNEPAIDVDDCFIADASKVNLILAQANTPWTSYTPVVTGSGGNPTYTTGTVAGKWRQRGQNNEYEISITTGSSYTVGSGRIDVSLPSGHSIDPNNLASGSIVGNNHYGSGVLVSATTSYPVEVVQSSSASTVSFQAEASTTRSTFATPFAWAANTAGQSILAQFSVPIVGNAANLTAAYQNAQIVPTVQILTATSGTYTTPSRALLLMVEMCGGGGGGGGGGSAGGSAGGNGGSATFGTSLLTANGGSGGASGAGSSQGGSSTTGTINSPAYGFVTAGNDGGSGQITTGALSNATTGGQGSPTPFFGGGGKGGTSTSNAPAAGSTNTGAGGGGGGASSATAGAGGGGGGGSGGCLRAYIPSPSSSYAYAIPAGGTAGTAGTSGGAGAAGAAGKIVVTEYYTTSTPITINSLTTTNNNPEKHNTARVTCSSSSTIDSQSGTWLTAIGNISSGTCAITIAAGIYSTAPRCSVNYGTSTAANVFHTSATITSATSGVLYCRYLATGSSTVNNCTSEPMVITCDKD